MGWITGKDIKNNMFPTEFGLGDTFHPDHLGSQGTQSGTKVLYDDGVFKTLPEPDNIDWVDIINKPATFTPSAHTHTVAGITDFPSTTSFLSNSTNKNFVTDAQLTVIGNTSGTNTGDNSTNTQYSGLAASKQDALGFTPLNPANNLSDVSNSTASRNNILPSKTGNALKYMRVNAGETDYEVVTLAGGGDLLSTNNLSDLTNAGTARTNLSLGNVNNTSDANKPVSTATQAALDLKANLASPTFTGTPVVPSAITVGGNTITFPAVTATLLPNTTTSGVGTSPTSSSTTTVTHNLGRIPTTIRIYGYGTFTSNAAATATTSSIGVYTSSGNFCVYQRYGAAITTTQAGLSSNTFAILLATGGGNFISGVIQNVTSTSFDIVWTETGTATAQVYLWEAQ